MKKIPGLSLVCILIWFVGEINLQAQSQLYSYADFGTNSVSDGLYIRAAGLGNFTFGKYSLTSGIQLDLKSKNENFLTGINFAAARDFTLWNFDFKVRCFYKWTFFSGLLRISDFGIMEGIDRSHLTFAIGTHFKTFSLTEEALWYYDQASETKIHENWNFLYLINYRIKKKENDWNIGICLTNIDYFIISQTTNPSFNINGSYRINPNLNLFAETWLKSSGAFNANVNYFGFFLRTGIVWNIGS